MKRTIALGFALSLLTATGAFASNSPTQVAATSTSTSAEQMRVAGPGNMTFDRAQVEAKKPVVVAENRKEFGSQYQRY